MLAEGKSTGRLCLLGSGSRAVRIFRRRPPEGPETAAPRRGQVRTAYQVVETLRDRRGAISRAAQAGGALILSVPFRSGLIDTRKPVTRLSSHGPHVACNIFMSLRASPLQ